MRRHALVLVLLLGAAACTRGYGEAADVLDPSGGASSPAAPSGSVTASAAPEASLSPEVARIEVRSPLSGDTVLSPLAVRGTAKSATGEVVVRVIGADRSELASIATAIDCGAACRGSFRVALAFYTPGRQEGAIQVFELGSGGSADHLVEVPVTLVPGV